MPRFRDLTVCVTDAGGNDLEEWGVQNLRSQNKTSAYIQATTNMAFNVTIQPRFPFHDPYYSTACHNDLTMDEQVELQEHEKPIFEFETRNRQEARGCIMLTSKTLRAIGDPINKKKPIDDNFLSMALDHRHTRSYREFHDTFDRHSGPSSESTCYSPPVGSQAMTSGCPPVPFNLLASLFLDGRQKPERKIVVYLDIHDEDFAYPDGRVAFKSRWVQGNDGNLKEHCWVFKDVGIETAFDKMLISGDEKYAEILEEEDEMDMIASMKATGLGAEKNLEEDNSNVGQILVVIERVVLGRKWQDNHYRPKHKEGEAEDVDMAGVKNDITHTTGLEHTGTRSSRTRVVSYVPYIEGEKPFATFQFFYRSQETLEKFGFPGFPRSSKLSARGRRHMEETFANMTPLSIGHPMSLSKRKGRSFEENAKEVTFSEAGKRNKCNDTHRQLATVKVKSNGMSKCKHLPSTKSTLDFVKSASTSPRKHHLQVLETRHQGGEQYLSSETCSFRPNGFTAEQISQAALSVSSLLECPKSSATTSSSSVPVSISQDSSTQNTTSKLAAECLKPKTKESPLKLPSSVMSTVDTKAAPGFIKLSSSEYRGSGQASDADDERDESDIDPSTRNNIHTDVESITRDTVVPNPDNGLDKGPDNDDEDLHAKLQKMLLTKSKKRRTKNGIKEEYNSESSTTSPLKSMETKLESSPSKFGLLSGTAEDADEEDNATKKDFPPVLLHHRGKRAKL
ncbi:hypothetical protein MMC07_007045 [Pseudocyphellaria aurata]|nr:hypothetical protein [Pseudocyphellaria aurata]